MLSSHSDLRFGLMQVVLGVDTSRCQPVEEDKHCEENECDDGNTAKNGLAVAKVGPLATGLTSITLDRLIAKLVVHHASKSDAVSKELETSNLSTPNDHGRNDEEDILEDTTEGEHKRRCLADLNTIVRSMLRNEWDELILTRRTTATFSMKAHTPLRKKVNRPTW